MQENKEYKEININEINENEKRKSCGKQCIGMNNNLNNLKRRS
jgi:hypothetical protein